VIAGWLWEVHVPVRSANDGKKGDRHYLIINLAEIWNWLGKAPSAGPKSSFVDFCAVIAVSIGWPSEGIESAAPNALKDWLNLTAYRKRLSK
jgi:hypothetical protein